LVLPVAPPDTSSDGGPLSAGAAFLVVNALTALALALLATCARVRGIGLALLLFVALYGIQTVVLQIETLYFNNYLHLPMATLANLLISQAITAVLVALVGALLFRGESAPAEPLPRGLALRIALLS